MSKRRVRSAFSPSFDQLAARIAPSTFVPPPDPYAGDTTVIMTGLSETCTSSTAPTTYTCNGDTLVLNCPTAS